MLAGELWRFKWVSKGMYLLVVDLGKKDEGGQVFTFQCAFGFALAEVSCCVDVGERFLDAGDGGFVGCEVEVADCFLDELGVVSSVDWRISCRESVQMLGARRGAL